MTKLILPDQDTEQLQSCRYSMCREEYRICLYTDSECRGNLSRRPVDCPLVEVKDEEAVS